MRNQQWTQSGSTHFDTYTEAAEHKATLEGRVKIRRRDGFDVITYKELPKKDAHLEVSEESK